MIFKSFQFIILILTTTIFFVVGFSTVKAIWNLILVPIFPGVESITTFEAIILSSLLFVFNKIYETFNLDGYDN